MILKVYLQFNYVSRVWLTRIDLQMLRKGLIAKNSMIWKDMFERLWYAIFEARECF